MLRLGGFLLAMAGGAALLNGCFPDHPDQGVHPCSGTYNCPAIPSVTIFFPSGLSSPLVSVTGDSTCLAELDFVSDGGDGERPVSVQELVLTPGQATTCSVQGTLADGTHVATSVMFKPVMNGCCPGFAVYVDKFGPVDAGADAR
jgi:hypothetical protein